MSTPEHDQASTPPLTRRQLREIRNTGSTPVITPASEEPAPAQVPLPRAATPAPVPPAPLPDVSVDLGVSPLTRRQAREQERIRTASVPIISPDVLQGAAVAEPKLVREEVIEQPTTEEVRTLFTPPEDEPVSLFAPVFSAAPVAPAAPVAAEPEPSRGDDVVQDAAPGPAATVSSELGSGLLSGEAPKAELPASFDQLLTRESTTTGVTVAPNALILSQTPNAPALTGPIAATGEVLVTGSYDLPEGLGSRGHAPGTTDGTEADAVLIDGELPASSSPTPIAASAAISTVKAADEIIRPPEPEKGGRLMLVLAITAGALALALVGVLIAAVVTGVFS